MPAGLLVAIALLAEPAAAEPEVPAPAEEQASLAEECESTRPTADTTEIVVCVQKPQGYRINPDVLEAKRAARSGRPKRPERMADKSCQSVGPAGCIGAGAGIDLLGAAVTAATMAARLSRGEEIGSMFRTTPSPSEYQLYVEAKRAREEREAEARAAAVAKAAKAEAQSEAAAAEAPLPR